MTTTIKEAVESFRAHYSTQDLWKEVWSIGVDETYGVIHVYTSNAKIWVDLPAKHEGYVVKMNVTRRSKPINTIK